MLRYSDGPYEILGQKTLTREFQGLAEYAPKPDFMADSFLALPPTEVRPLLQLLDDRRARATLEDWARKLGATRILVLGGSTEDRSVDRPEVDARFQGFQQGRDWAVSMFAFGDQPWLQTTDNRPSGKTPTGLPEAVKRRIRIEFLAIRKK